MLFTMPPYNKLLPNLGNVLADRSARTLRVIENNSIGKFFSQLFSGVDSLGARLTGARLTGAEREANAFTAEREDIAWQREMEASNTQYQRSVADMQAAGINPMLAVSNGGASAPSASSSGSVSPSPSNLGEILSAVLGFQKFGLEKMLASKQANVLEEQASNIAADTSLKKQKENESRETERGARIVNDIKEASKDFLVESARLKNNIDRATEKRIYKEMDLISVNMSKAQAETDSEYIKQSLMEAEKAFKTASAWQIYKLTPAIENYYNAQSQSARGAAAASFVKAAYDLEVLNSGYIDSMAREAAAKAGIAEDEKVIKDIATGLRTGDWSNISTLPQFDKISQALLSGLTITLDNLNPLAGLLK